MKSTPTHHAWRSHPARPKTVIDVHAHVGKCKSHPWLGTNDLSEVLDRAASVGVDISIISHIDAVYYPEKYGKSANCKLLRQCEKRRAALMWWVVDPRSQKSIDLIRHHAGHPKIVGMKIGPTYHNYPFRRYARVILDLASELDLAVLTHSGQPNDMPGDIVSYVNHYPDVRFVIAHFGNCLDFQGHLRAFKKCTSKRCFVDTSSAMSMYCNHIENGVRQLGASRFLFGTDTPLYSTAAQCARILEANLTVQQKRAILGDNARKLLLPQRR